MTLEAERDEARAIARRLAALAYALHGHLYVLVYPKNEEAIERAREAMVDAKRLRAEFDALPWAKEPDAP